MYVFIGGLEAWVEKANGDRYGANVLGDSTGPPCPLAMLPGMLKSCGFDGPEEKVGDRGAPKA